MATEKHEERTERTEQHGSARVTKDEPEAKTEQQGSFRLTRMQTQAGQGFTTDRRIYETQDGRVVGEDDPEAFRLIAGAGGTIDARTAERLHLTEKGQKLPPRKAGEPVPSTAATQPAPEQPAETAGRPAETTRPVNTSSEPREGKRG